MRAKQFFTGRFASAWLRAGFVARLRSHLRMTTGVVVLALVMMALVVGVAAIMLAMAPVPAQAEADAVQSLRLPFVRRNHSLIYDQDNGRLILFGGWNGRRFLNDVWALEVDTGTWYQVQASGAPPPSRAWHAAAMDSANSRMVVIGGKGYGGDLGDVWALDLSPGNETWTELEPEWHSANFSPRRAVAATIGPYGVNLFGGVSEGQLLSEMAVLDWISGPGNESWFPPAEIGLDRSGGAAVWHHPGDRFVLFGGADQDGNIAEVHTVAESSPYTVSPLAPDGSPPEARRFHTAVYYDDFEGGDLVERMVGFGGLGDSGFVNDVWELRLDEGQEAWQEITTSGDPPPARAGHAAAYVDVEGNNRMYVVGGFGPYDMLADRGWVLDLDTNTWQPLSAGVDWPKLDVSLQVEGAREGVVVNKVADSTLVVNVKLSNYYVDATEDLTVTLTVHGNVLDFVKARMRNSEADPGYGVSSTDLGGGQFQVADVDLYLHGNRYQRVVEFQFDLVTDVVLGYVPLTVQVEVPGYNAVLDSTGVVNIVDSAEALVVANRGLLYERYDEAEVNDLLAGVFQAVQGGGWNESPLGVVVYLDRYTTAENWDNTAVDYSDEWTANSMANEIAAEIHHFWVWADAPEYLLIVGDDDLIPFYRHWDGTEYAGLVLYDCDGLPGCEHPGWCEDSETNPAIHATDENYYFTDDFYANMSGSDWLEGELELAAGRLVGETAADMLNLLRSGTRLEQEGTYQVALFSLGGWQLGLEPTTEPDAIPNLLNVPARFGARGFEVRNDAEWPRTVDVMTPYSWGQEEFDAILDDGFDLFFEGADVACGYGYICPAHALFGPLDVREGRVSTDRPVFFLADAHTGLTVPAPEGGANGDLVLALAREGSRAIIGPTSTSLGSAYSLDYCIYSELFAQEFFNELLSPLSGESRPLGVAMREAKQSYPFGLAAQCEGAQDADERTITTHVLYGVPWQTLYYPEFVPWIPPALPFSAGQPGLAAGQQELGQQTVGLIDSGSYSQIFTADFTYTVTISDGWDILTVPGARLDASDGYPLLPSAEVFTLCLPLSTTVTGLEVVSDSAASVGPYNIPNVQVLPFELGGLAYTTTSAVDTLYPATVITGEQRGHLFVVRAMPVQHNPINDETWFHNHLEVRLTYTTPTPVAVCSFATNARRYLPGQTMGTVAILQNVGDANLVLTRTLALLDPLARVRSFQVGASFDLPGGGVVAVPMTGTVPLEDGGYRAVFSVWDQGERKARAIRSVAALGGYITGLEPSGPLLLGRANQFAVTWANPWPDPTIAFLHLAVFDESGQAVDELSPQVISVTGVSTATATFDWTPVGLPPGQYTAAAWVTARGQAYGPLSHSFRVVRLYLPLVFR
jgi:hypothetical protein